ncbi:hypothetical protein [Calidifontibacter indicus]|uniref:hypothetical protein n=1 Tax=Calidifontibacter indicus TaxID=419650 RepID=UPI003D75707C
MRHDILELFDADPTVLHLNTGAFGMVPRTVRAAQQRWSDRIRSHRCRSTSTRPIRRHHRAKHRGARSGLLGDQSAQVVPHAPRHRRVVDRRTVA